MGNYPIELSYNEKAQLNHVYDTQAQLYQYYLQAR